MFTTLWVLIQAYPLQFLLVSLSNWILGYWVGRSLLRKDFHQRMSSMTNKWLDQKAAAMVWRDEVEDLVLKIGDKDE